MSQYTPVDSSPSTPSTTRSSTPTGEVDEAEVVVAGEDEVTSFVWILVCAAAISGLLFGYDTGVISGTLVIIGQDLGQRLSDGQKELITSATTLGALIGGVVAGALSDYTGRKPVIAVANVVFIAGAIGQAVCHTVPAMIAGRFIIGLGVGLASCVVPLYIGELAPTRIRGRLVTINVVAITLGQVFAYAIGAALQHVDNGWRFMVGIGGAPAIIQLAALAFLPESPRILLRRGHKGRARRILAKIYPFATPLQIERKVKVMDAAVKQSAAVDDASFWTRLASFRIGSNRRALIVGCALQASQQLCGFNTLMYYSATLFAMVGFKNSTAVGLLIASVNFVFTLVALRIVDPVGRRRVMLWTVPVMVVALALAAVFFHYLTLDTGGQLEENATYSPTWSALVLVAMIVYVAGYATGLGNIPWQQGELFRLDVRGIGTSLCTATNWSCNLLIAATFLSLMKAATPAGAFAIYSSVCALSWVFTYLCYPETSGLSLEQVCALFEHDFGVR